MHKYFQKQKNLWKIYFIHLNYSYTLDYCLYLCCYIIKVTATVNSGFLLVFLAKVINFQGIFLLNSFIQSLWVDCSHSIIHALGYPISFNSFHLLFHLCNIAFLYTELTPSKFWTKPFIQFTGVDYFHSIIHDLGYHISFNSHPSISSL